MPLIFYLHGFLGKYLKNWFIDNNIPHTCIALNFTLPADFCLKLCVKSADNLLTNVPADSVNTLVCIYLVYATNHVLEVCRAIIWPIGFPGLDDFSAIVMTLKCHRLPVVRNMREGGG